MRPVTRNAASSTVTNNEEDGGNQDKGEKTGNELPTPSATGPDTALDVTAIVQAAVQTAVRKVVTGMALLQTQAVASPVSGVGETARLVPCFNPLLLSCPTVDTWIRRIDDLADIYQWTDRMTSCNALTKLEGPARSWYDSLSSVDKTWTEWKEELRRAFPSATSMQRLHRDMEDRRRKRGEPIESYYYDKLSKARRCNLGDEACIEYIITGLNDEGAIRAVSVRTYESPEELLHCLKRLEERLGNMASSASPALKGASSSPLTSRRRFENGADRATGSKSEARRERVDPPPLRPRKKPLINERGETLCFNCDDYGHVSMNCPSPQRKARCGVCKRVGHDAKDCREKRESGPRVAQNVADANFRAAEAANEKYFMPAKLNGHEVRAYVDLGSQCVTLRQEDADRLKISYSEPAVPFTIGGYGSGRVTPCGETSATIAIDQATADVQLFVVPSSSQSIPLLVGQPFTEQPHVTVVRRRNTVRIFEERENVHENDDTLRSIEIPDLPQRSVCLWAK